MPTCLSLVVHAATLAQRAALFPTSADALTINALDDAASITARLGRVDHAWCSPSRAALETADALGLSVSTEPLLSDWSTGRWAGRPVREIALEDPDRLAAWLSGSDTGPPDGETAAALIHRIGSWMTRIAADGGRHLAVTHPAIARAAVAYAMMAGPGVFHSIDPDPLCLVQLDGRNGRWRLRAMIPPHRPDRSPTLSPGR